MWYSISGFHDRNVMRLALVSLDAYPSLYDVRGAQPIAKYACLAASSFASCLLAPEPVPFSRPLTGKNINDRTIDSELILNMLTDTLHSPLPSMRRTGELRRIFYEHSPLIRSLVKEGKEGCVRLSRR